MADRDSRAGKRYAVEGLIKYVDDLHAPHDQGLEGAFGAPDREDMPAIQLGRSEGKLLEMLLRLAGAKKVVEVGTLAGYSAVRIARALPEGGKLWTIEYEAKHAEVARKVLADAGHADRVEVLVGAGVDVLPTIEQHGPFDAVFIDADKVNYDEYGAWAARHLRPGGLLIGDNAYFFGRLLEQDDDGAAAMRCFHEQALQAFDTVCVPTPDGLLLGVKR
jgi:caffeoyl-CoA O-methyltransferase